MFCTNCGKPLPDGTSFCTNCGKDLRMLTAKPAPAEMSTPVMDATPAPVAEESAMTVPNFSPSDAVMDVSAVPAAVPAPVPAPAPVAPTKAPEEKPAKPETATPAAASVDLVQLLQTLAAGGMEFSFKLRTAEGKELTISGKADVSVN